MVCEIFKKKIVKFLLKNPLQTAEKLQAFEYTQFPDDGDISDESDISDDSDIRITIDVDTFKKLVQIVELRREKYKLKLLLSGAVFTADIPAEFAEAASNLLTLAILTR